MKKSNVTLLKSRRNRFFICQSLANRLKSGMLSTIWGFACSSPGPWLIHHETCEQRSRIILLSFVGMNHVSLDRSRFASNFEPLLLHLAGLRQLPFQQLADGLAPVSLPGVLGQIRSTMFESLRPYYCGP